MIRELLPPETGLAFDAMQALRTDVADEKAFVRQVNEVRGPRATAWSPHSRKQRQALVEEGKRLGCDQLHLDSGVGLDRSDAHRLYLNAGLVISAHHFARHVS